MAAQNLGFSLICVFGSFLQEFSLYRESNLFKLPLSPAFYEKNWFLTLVFTAGALIELFSWTQTSFIQVLVLSSCHLSWFKIFYANDHEVSFVKAEKIGFGLIGAAVFVVSSESGNDFSTENVLIDFFIVYQVSAIVILLVMRKLGFFSRKTLFEAVIPAQLVVSFLTGFRVFYDVCLKDSEEAEEKNLVFPAVLLIFICCGLASSLVKNLLKSHDIVVFLAMFQTWTLVFGFFITFFLGFQSLNKASFFYGFAAVLAIAGNSLISLHRVEFLKGVNQKNIDSFKARDDMLEDVQEDLDPQNLELQIVEDNLMDAEIIDEDLLIKTIRNI